jgi:hypothetical protein
LITFCDQRIPETEKVQKHVQPEQESQYLEEPVRPALKHWTMQTDDPQRAQGAHMQGDNDHGFDDPDSGIKRGRKVNAS